MHRRNATATRSTHEDTPSLPPPRRQGFYRKSVGHASSLATQHTQTYAWSQHKMGPVSNSTTQRLFSHTDTAGTTRSDPNNLFPCRSYVRVSLGPRPTSSLSNIYSDEALLYLGCSAVATKRWHRASYGLVLKSQLGHFILPVPSGTLSPPLRPEACLLLVDLLHSAGLECPRWTRDSSGSRVEAQGPIVHAGCGKDFTTHCVRWGQSHLSTAVCVPIPTKLLWHAIFFGWPRVSWS